MKIGHKIRLSPILLSQPEAIGATVLPMVLVVYNFATKEQVLNQAVVRVIHPEVHSVMAVGLVEETEVVVEVDLRCKDPHTYYCHTTLAHSHP